MLPKNLSTKSLLTRNLLFIGMCAVGLSALGASLWPIHRRGISASPEATPHGAASPAADLADVSERLNAALAKQWTLAGVVPAAPADDLLVARRLSLALTGTVPSLEEVRQFESQPAEDRLNWWLESRLGDRRTDDYLAERLARPLVGVEGGPFIIFRRRRFVAWLADQLEQNLPYDEVVTEVLSATGLWTDRPATNFITVTIKPDQGQGPDENELAGRVARAFLGIRMDCAQCHDHPFDVWKQGDFQGLAAFFGQAEQKFSGIQDDPHATFEVENRISGKLETIAPKVPFREELLPADGPLRARLASWVTQTQNRAFGRATANRMWGILFGRPLVDPVDDVGQSEHVPEALDILADDFATHGHDLRRLIRTIARSAPYGFESRAADDADDSAVAKQAAAWAEFPLTRMRPEQVVGGLLQAASLRTIDYQSHIVVRAIRAGTQNDFIQRYGDVGADEFARQGGTIPQRLLMMNGKQVFERTKEDLLMNAATRVAVLAPSDERAVETAYLAVLTRRPTPAEAEYFVGQLADKEDKRSRNERMEDLYWTLLNSTEFSWNH